MINRVITTLLFLWLGSTLQVRGQQPTRVQALVRIKANAEKGDAGLNWNGLLYASGRALQDVVKAAKWTEKPPTRSSSGSIPLDWTMPMVRE